MSRKTKQRRRFKRINAKATNATWRNEPATAKQRRRLTYISSQTGELFEPSITRGQASDAITAFDATDGRTTRWRPRRQDANQAGRDRRRRAPDPSSWRFGVGQHWREHLAEIRAAQHAGLERDYLEAQQRARHPR